jgi:hypothetical protein
MRRQEGCENVVYYITTSTVACVDRTVVRMSYTTLLQVKFSNINRMVVRMSFTTLLQVQFLSVDRTVVRMSYDRTVVRMSYLPYCKYNFRA